MCVTDRHDTTLAVKVALNPNQPTNRFKHSSTNVHIFLIWTDLTLKSEHYFVTETIKNFLLPIV